MANTHLFALINIIGGTLVLGSYVFCIYFYPEYRESFWGGVHGNTRKFFTFSMLPAAIGYLLFFYCAVSDLKLVFLNIKVSLGKTI